jgi:signal transduction histidine kinase
VNWTGPRPAALANILSRHAVPVRALSVSLLAMTVAVVAAVFWPQAIVDQEILAGGLALIPALLLAHYRGWAIVSILLGVGLVALTFIHLSPDSFGISLRGPFLILFVVAPYISIALGAGWVGEVRRYQAELRATQLQLIQSEKLDSVGRMAAGVAHEVKNPLMMILTGVNVLSKRLVNADESTRQILHDMTEAVERADRIIGGLLNYSRDHDLDLAPADINATLEAAVMLVHHDLEAAGIEVVKRLSPDLPQLAVDEFKIQQVFVNVIINAIHAMGDGGRLVISTSLEKMPRGAGAGYGPSDRYVPGERVAVIRVDDSGPGIPEYYLERVFDPFFTTKPVGRGTGLGLSVSHQIVELHGGTIEVANREEGGARVTIILKLGTEEART